MLKYVVCMFVYLFMLMCVGMCVEIRGQYQMSGIFHNGQSPPFIYLFT